MPDSLQEILNKNPNKSYRIGEVAKLIGVEIHVLRYWENEFKSFIHSHKTTGGQRLYSSKDVEIILNIKKLISNEGYRIDGAKKKLKEIYKVEAQDLSSKTVPRDLLVVVKEELQDIYKRMKRIMDDVNQK
jgi:DNA-binding transcriptional MerR regulator